MRLHDVACIGTLIALANVGFGCSTTVTTTPAASGGEVTPSGCTPDDSVDCSSGGDGWTCPAGNNPQQDETGLACSVPQEDGANDDFCCIVWTSTTCTPVDTSFGSGSSFVCSFNSYGYQCVSGDDPSSLDSSLTNCTSAPDPDGVHEDFCCP